MPHFGLIGNPLTHSFSKKYFSEKFKNEHLTGYSYTLFPLERIEDLPNFIKTHSSLNGFNVTIPYKTSIIPFLDEIDSEASEIGAVNTVSIHHTPKKTILKGYNTDVVGFERVLSGLIGSLKLKALILGTGGASRAVAYVLEKKRIPFLKVSRHKKDFKFIDYQCIDKLIIQEHLLVINTTPLGMYPDIHSYPALPYHLLTPNHYLLDLVYNPKETEFLRQGKKQGCRVLNGIQMLYLQADSAFGIWTRNVL